MITAIALFALGLCAGSFINALVWRIRQQSILAKSQKPKAKSQSNELSVLSGRSQCVHCGHQLAIKDLIPLLSWLLLRGKCRYCKKPISVQYPIVELSAGLIFVISYLFWPTSDFQGSTLEIGQVLLFATWLLVSIGLLALLVYDYKWMLLPNRILYPTALVAVLGRLIYIAGFSPEKSDAFIQWVLAVGVASGIFWLLFVASSGKWIGYGDVRLGLITGTVLGAPGLAFLMIFIASILGTLFVLPAMASGKTTMTSRVPFGPFLIVATFLTLLSGQQLIDKYIDLIY